MYIKNLNCEFTYSKENIGMPSALNKASKLAKNDYIVANNIIDVNIERARIESNIDIKK